MTDARVKGAGFYRYYFRGFFIFLLAAMVGILVLVGVIVYQIHHRPLPQFIAIAQNGQQMQITAQEEPNYLSSTIIKWARKAAVASYTYDFVNADKQLAAVKSYYTDAGWKVFSESIAQLIGSIKANQLFVNGVVSGPPVISNQGDISMRGYVWRVQMPFLVTYQTSDTATHKQFYVTLTIVKVPTWQNPAGIGIDQFVM